LIPPSDTALNTPEEYGAFFGALLMTATILFSKSLVLVFTSTYSRPHYGWRGSGATLILSSSISSGAQCRDMTRQLLYQVSSTAFLFQRCAALPRGDIALSIMRHTVASLKRPHPQEQTPIFTRGAGHSASPPQKARDGCERSKPYGAELSKGRRKHPAHLKAMCRRKKIEHRRTLGGGGGDALRECDIELAFAWARPTHWSVPYSFQKDLQHAHCTILNSIRKCADWLTGLSKTLEKGSSLWRLEPSIFCSRCQLFLRADIRL
jgi:hypothetical protein